MNVQDWYTRKNDYFEDHALYRVHELNSLWEKHPVTGYDIISVDENNIGRLSETSTRFVIRFMSKYHIKYIYVLPKSISSEESNKLADELMIFIKLMG
jgi:hypothetical protein